MDMVSHANPSPPLLTHNLVLLPMIARSHSSAIPPWREVENNQTRPWAGLNQQTRSPLLFVRLTVEDNEPLIGRETEA